jgi:hypothetical protein
VHDFFVANYKNYLNLINTGLCKPTTAPPADPTLNDMLTHVYGWVPWNDCGNGAADSATNPLNNPPNTPNYGAVHQTYISLQYLPPLGTFNPYVDLVHGPTYLDMPGSYAFSIDDLVGNIHVPGQGVIVTVAGPNGLDNMVQYVQNNVVKLSLGDPRPLMRPAWQQFVRCGVPPANIPPPPTGLGSLKITSANYPCMVKLTDASNRSYTFTLASPPYPSATGPDISACTVTPPDTAMTWCKDAKALTQPDPNTPGLNNNIVQLDAPVP